MSLSLGLGFFAGVRQTVVAHALDLGDNKKLEAQGWEVGGRRTREGRRDHHCPKCFFLILRPPAPQYPAYTHPTTRNLDPAITLIIMFKYHMAFLCHCSNFSVWHFL